MFTCVRQQQIHAYGCMVASAIVGLLDDMRRQMGARAARGTPANRSPPKSSLKPRSPTVLRRQAEAYFDFEFEAPLFSRFATVQTSDPEGRLRVDLTGCHDIGEWPVL